MAIEDDDRPRKKVTHEIGQDLSLLSVEELTERIALLKSRNRTAAGGASPRSAPRKDAGQQRFQVSESGSVGHGRMPAAANGRHGK